MGFNRKGAVPAPMLLPGGLQTRLNNRLDPQSSPALIYCYLDHSMGAMLESSSPDLPHLRDISYAGEGTNYHDPLAGEFLGITEKTELKTFTGVVAQSYNPSP